MPKYKCMETKRKKSAGKSVKQNEIAEVTEQKPKSKTMLFWEKYYPDGSKGEIINMRAVMKWEYENKKI